MTEAAKQDFTNLSFEQALGELETIVKRLETGQTTLEQSIADYERGAALKTYCETKLREASMKVEKIVASADGTLKTEPFEAA